MFTHPLLWRPPDGSPSLAAWEVGSEDSRLVVVPERGGKIVSLFHQPTGVEWLWLNETLPWRSPAPTDSYVARHDLGGWDECFPTVAPTLANGRRWPDHGDLWWRTWQSAPRGDGLWTGVEGDGYTFERTIQPAPKGFRLDYRVENRSGAPFPYLWCAHPLFCIDPPLTLEIEGRPSVRLGSDSPLGETGETHRWPTLCGRDFGQVGKPSGLAVKLFVTMIKGEVSLCHSQGGELRLRWPVERLPVLGLWVNEGGWNGAGGPPHCNLGVEPATGSPDDLMLAKSPWHPAKTMQAGERHSWWVDIEMSG